MVYMVDNGYSAEEILKAERYLLGMLKFNISAPGPFNFLKRIIKIDDNDSNLKLLSTYFMEST